MCSCCRRIINNTHFQTIFNSVPGRQLNISACLVPGEGAEGGRALCLLSEMRWQRSGEGVGVPAPSQLTSANSQDRVTCQRSSERTRARQQLQRNRSFPSFLCCGLLGHRTCSQHGFFVAELILQGDSPPQIFTLEALLLAEDAATPGVPSVTSGAAPCPAHPCEQLVW